MSDCEKVAPEYKREENGGLLFYDTVWDARLLCSSSCRGRNSGGGLGDRFFESWVTVHGYTDYGWRRKVQEMPIEWPRQVEEQGILQSNIGIRIRIAMHAMDRKDRQIEARSEPSELNLTSHGESLTVWTFRRQQL